MGLFPNYDDGTASTDDDGTASTDHYDDGAGTPSGSADARGSDGYDDRSGWSVGRGVARCAVCACGRNAMMEVDALYGDEGDDVYVREEDVLDMLDDLELEAQAIALSSFWVGIIMGVVFAASFAAALVLSPLFAFLTVPSFVLFGVFGAPRVVHAVYSADTFGQ